MPAFEVRERSNMDRDTQPSLSKDGIEPLAACRSADHQDSSGGCTSHLASSSEEEELEKPDDADDVPESLNPANRYSFHRLTRKEKTLRIAQLTFDDLKQYFHLPLHQAANKLRLCGTVLKRVSRRCGIPTWPFRQIRDLSSRIESLEGLLKTLSHENSSPKAESVRRELAIHIKSRNRALKTGQLSQIPIYPRHPAGSLKREMDLIRNPSADGYRKLSVKPKSSESNAAQYAPPAVCSYPSSRQYSYPYPRPYWGMHESTTPYGYPQHGSMYADEARYEPSYQGRGDRERWLMEMQLRNLRAGDHGRKPSMFQEKHSSNQGWVMPSVSFTRAFPAVSLTDPNVDPSFYARSLGSYPGFHSSPYANAHFEHTHPSADAAVVIRKRSAEPTSIEVPKKPRTSAPLVV